MATASCGGDSDDAGRAEYLSALEERGYGDYFVDDEAAVAYLENYCKTRAAAGGAPTDALDAVVADFCDSDLARARGFAATVEQGGGDEQPPPTERARCQETTFAVTGSIQGAVTVQGLARAVRSISADGLFYVGVEVIASSSTERRGDFAVLVTDDMANPYRLATLVRGDLFNLPAAADLGYAASETHAAVADALNCSQAVAIS